MMVEKQPVTIADLTNRKKAATQSVRIVLDPDVADQANKIKEQIDEQVRRPKSELGLADKDPVQELEKKLDRLIKKALADGSVYEFVFKSVGKKRFDDLIRDNPPDAETKKLGGQWDPDTFGPALLAASAVDPVMSYDEAKVMWESDSWNQGELLLMFTTAVDVNTEKVNLPLSRSGSAQTKRSR